MGINIDEFLDRYVNDEVEDKVVETKEEISLDFEEEVQKRIEKVKSRATPDSEFSIVQKIYEEMKKFDENLPRKFIGIDHTGELALKELGGKYSKKFLSQVKINARVISDELLKHLNAFSEAMKDGRLDDCLSLHLNILNLYGKLPREFLDEKLQIGKRVKESEIQFAKRIQTFSGPELNNIKKKIREEISETLKLMKSGNAGIVEQKLENLEIMLGTLPRLFLGSLGKEFQMIKQTVIKGEEFILQDYHKEFDEKKEIIYSLKEKYRKYILEKKAQNALLIYNEIILHFRSLPEVFLEKKIELFEEINSLYTSINETLVRANINSFVINYNSSKIIEESRDYIRRVKHSGRFSRDNVELLLKKIGNLPSRFEDDKKELTMVLNKILLATTYEQHIKTEKFQEKVDFEDNNKEVKKSINNSFDKSNNALLEEMNSLYKDLKNSSSKEKKSEIYRKLMFYLDLSPLTDSEKRKMKDKITKDIS